MRTRLLIVSLLGLALCGASRAEVSPVLRQRLDQLRAARDADDPAPLARPARDTPVPQVPGDYPAFNLERALEFAERHSYVFAKLKFELDASRVARSVAGAHPEMHFMVGLQYSLRNGDYFSEEPFLGLSQPFDLFGNRRAARLVADKDVKMAQLAIRGFHQRLRYDVSSKYRMLQYREAAVRAARFSVALARSFQRVARLRRDAGTVPELDVIRAQAELYKAQADRVSAELEEVKARAAMAKAIGFENWEKLEVTGTLDSFEMVTSYETLLAMANVNRVDIQSLEVAVRKLGAERNNSRQKRLPLVRGTFQVKDDPGRRSERFGGVMIDFVPLWYGRIDKEMKHKVLLSRAVRQDIADRKRLMRISLSEGTARVEKLKKRLDVLQYQEVPKTARQLETVEKGYRAGGLSNLAVLEAQRRVVEVLGRYLLTLSDYHQELLLLTRETGMGIVETTPVETSRYVQKWIFED